MMTYMLSCLIPSLAAGPDAGFTVAARIDADALTVGQTYEIVIEWKTTEAFTSDGAGIPAPILQIDPPASIVLDGPVLREHRALAKNEFLHAPYERLLEASPARMAFSLRKEPRADERIGLNLVAYLGSGESAGARFIRRRMEIPVAAGATAVEADAGKSNWGKNRFFQIGDRAESFTLPRADGSKVSLKQLLDTKHVFVTTYRAHW